MDSAIDTTMFDVSAFPTRMTVRIVLRESQVADADDLLALRRDADEKKLNSLPIKDLDESVTLIVGIWPNYARQFSDHWAVALAETGRVIGLFGFSAWERYH